MLQAEFVRIVMFEAVGLYRSDATLPGTLVVVTSRVWTIAVREAISVLSCD